jgi:hypothetical protein
VSSAPEAQQTAAPAPRAGAATERTRRGGASRRSLISIGDDSNSIFGG